ncbi:MAG: hypothetical protein COV74_02480 [Candidatus Omnitrophica bacterium CG11_big_fil_rev_8_21_14_0_20_45_26]|uniref:Cytochrome c domain-containing protein n=1 Tax=Candidatus Abzuiibacterium crystallinum TaxID=1974748 RepID=A0A2H0LRG0_9BACT|nr:MAG: hypothetical protein COV74_02480 [Candidatus Omnitrophica bacterium CG11_big_fil_rev_8_21_14_0_20_45_26]PIW65703.1 MAG: hypothetical protein COW12_00325 [Candidatus Omnitrophica bacterium CG12_big_fil_rev_8_21_14_0_65_45_16]
MSHHRNLNHQAAHFITNERGSFFVYFGILIILLFLSTHPLFANTDNENQCIACHSDYWEEMQASIHSRNGVACQDCHGGDPAQADQALAKGPETGYIGVPEKDQAVQRCGNCHANVEFMNPYGIRTDQLARYLTSTHGKRVMVDHDMKAAACMDCHGYHDVIAVSDPNSPVYPSNVPKTCNHCHGNERLMEPYHHPTDVFDQYRESVHGKALFEKGNLAVANCAACHGSHGAVPPGVKDLGATCGKCHVNEKKYFLESPHAAAMVEGKFSECTSCHGFHDVQHPTAALYEKACLNCHATGTTEYQLGQAIERELNNAEQAFEKTKGTVKQAAIEGFFVEEEAANLEEVKTHLIEIKSVQHTLNNHFLTERHDAIVKSTDEIERSIRHKRLSHKQRQWMLVPIWVFIVIMVLVLYRKYKQLKNQKD